MKKYPIVLITAFLKEKGTKKKKKITKRMWLEWQQFALERNMEQKELGAGEKKGRENSDAGIFPQPRPVVTMQVLT